jgi:hypothetical protein
MKFEFPLSWFVVFVAVFALDFVWARYTRACATGTKLSAANYAAGIILLSGAAQIGYTNDYWLLLPAIVGAFGGTWCSMKLTETEP